MRIAIATSQAPFLSGGAEFLASNLKSALIHAGHRAEIVSMPFMDTPLDMIEDHIVAARLLDINASWAGETDLCIGLKFPAYFMPHKNKVMWILHQYRAAYDLFDTDFSSLKNDIIGNKIKEMVTNADNRYLQESKRIYTIAANVAKRMGRYNGIKAQPLYHPCPDMDKFFLGDYEDYILMPSRINITKRQHLAIEAMRHTKRDIKLFIVGGADHIFEQNRLTDKIKEYHLGNKVKYLGAVSQEEKFNLYANARAVLFIPYDEDYGYITLEAMSASKAVITTSDSGGPLEFVADTKTGIVASPNDKSIAEAIDTIASSSKLAQNMGIAANKHIKDMNISWANVVKELTKR